MSVRMCAMHTCIYLSHKIQQKNVLQFVQYFFLFLPKEISKFPGIVEQSLVPPIYPGSWHLDHKYKCVFSHTNAPILNLCLNGVMHRCWNRKHVFCACWFCSIGISHSGQYLAEVVMGLITVWASSWSNGYGIFNQLFLCCC